MGMISLGHHFVLEVFRSMNSGRVGDDSNPVRKLSSKSRYVHSAMLPRLTVVPF